MAAQRVAVALAPGLHPVPSLRCATRVPVELQCGTLRVSVACAASPASWLLHCGERTVAQGGAQHSPACFPFWDRSGNPWESCLHVCTMDSRAAAVWREGPASCHGETHPAEVSPCAMKKHGPSFSPNVHAWR